MKHIIRRSSVKSTQSVRLYNSNCFIYLGCPLTARPTKDIRRSYELLSGLLSHKSPFFSAMFITKRYQCSNNWSYSGMNICKFLRVRINWTHIKFSNKHFWRTESCLVTLPQSSVKPLQPTYVYSCSYSYLHFGRILVWLCYVLPSLTMKKKIKHLQP